MHRFEALRERLPSANRFARELVRQQGMSLHPTAYGDVPHDEILSSDKALVYMLSGYGGVRQSRAALEEVGNVFSAVEVGEPIHNGGLPAEGRHLLQSQRDSRAIEQFINETAAPDARGTLVCPSYATLTGLDFAIRNLHRVDRMIFLVPAGFRRRDNPFHITYRYIREAVRTNIPTVRELGRDGMAGTFTTFKKTLVDAGGSIRRMQAVLKGRADRDMRPILEADIPIVTILASEDGLFEAEETEAMIEAVMTQIYGAQTGEEGVVFAEEVKNKVQIRKRRGVRHDLGFNGKPRDYGKMLVEELLDTTPQPGR